MKTLICKRLHLTMKFTFNIKWALDDDKCTIKVKIGEMLSDNEKESSNTGWYGTDISC